MSKLTDRLEKVGQPSIVPLGFGSGAKKVTINPSLLVIGQGSVANLVMKRVSSDKNFDAFILELNSWSKTAVEKVAKALINQVWGVRIPSITEDQTEILKTLGGDFLVLDIGDTSAKVLNDEEIGTLISLGPDVDENTARGIQDLPLDGVISESHKDLFPITIRSLFTLLKSRGLIDKFFILQTPESLQQDDLETLRNIGTVAIVTDARSTKRVKAIKTLISNLPKPKSKKDRAIALVPQHGSSQDGHTHDPDDEYDDEGDY